jgi:c-di-GMP-binding flagellar brake protein YcgR
MAEPSPLPSHYTGKTEKITDPVRIAALLERLRKSRSLLAIEPDASGETFHSALLEIHPKRGYFVLDELYPKSGHDRLLATRRFKARARLDGVELSFIAFVESVGRSEGAGFYRVVLPGVLNYYQRRRHYRAKVGFSRHIPVTITLPDETKIEGRLRDISVGGIGATFPASFPESLAGTERVLDCRLVLPSNTEIRCRLAVCFVNHSVQDNSRVVGARFVELGAAQQKIVAEFVAALDRELVKKLPKR